MDELQKIITMIERQMYDYNLKADIGSTGEVFDEKVEDAKYQVCKDILSFVKSLQKEPVSDDIAMRMKVMEVRDRLSSAITSEKENAHDVDLMEVRESVPKELNNRILEEAIKHSERWKDFRGADAMKVSYSEFAFGAQWLYEQMMKDAVQGFINAEYQDVVSVKSRAIAGEERKKLGLHLCAKIKLIIIKEG